MDLYHYLFKFIIVGDASVGKSCILLQYTEKQFRDEHDTTIGVEFGSQIFKHKNQTIKIQIWDTAGQESFRSITRSYYKGSIGVILVFDITNEESFHNIQKWYAEVQEAACAEACICLVGNKLDLEAQRKVDSHKAQTYAQQNKMLYFETSAKTGQNIDSLFEAAAVDVIEKIDKKQINVALESSGIKLGTYMKQQQDVVTLENKPPQKQSQKEGCC